jgi:hypothetical protein
MLGAGEEGADFLRQLGLGAEGHHDDIAGLLTGLAGMDHPEARQTASACTQLAQLSREITGWITITSLAADVLPTHAFRAGDAVVVVRPLGRVVEWLVVGVPQLWSIVRAAIDDFETPLIVGHRSGDAVASMVICDGELRLAARSPAELEAMHDGAAGGLESAVRHLWGELRG